MVRVLVMLLALAGIDQYMLHGKFTDAGVSMSRTILHHFRLL